MTSTGMPTAYDIIKDAIASLERLCCEWGREFYFGFHTRTNNEAGTVMLWGEVKYELDPRNAIRDLVREYDLFLFDYKSLLQDNMTVSYFQREHRGRYYTVHLMDAKLSISPSDTNFNHLQLSSEANRVKRLPEAINGSLEIKVISRTLPHFPQIYNLIIEWRPGRLDPGKADDRRVMWGVWNAVFPVMRVVEELRGAASTVLEFAGGTLNSLEYSVVIRLPAEQGG